jgi:hypothetical protein
MIQTLDELELKSKFNYNIHKICNINRTFIVFNSSLEQVKEFEHWIRTTTEVGFKPKKRKFREL